MSRHFNTLLKPCIGAAELVDIGDPQRGDVVVFRYPNYERGKAYKGADFIIIICVYLRIGNE
jgi:signal peptidase I